MNLCADGHDEICFEARKCPACEIAAEKDKEISDLGEQIDALKSEVETLKGQIE